jgi:heme/copper-type cytochrome/quinol oxidase subunit 2
LEASDYQTSLKGKVQKHAGWQQLFFPSVQKRREIMYIILVISIIIVLVVLLLSVITTSKAYTYKHTVDPIDNNPHLKKQEGDSTKEEEKIETENKA